MFAHVEVREFHKVLQAAALYSGQRRRVHYPCASSQLRRTCSQASGLCLDWLTDEGKGKRMLPLSCHLLHFLLLPPCHPLPWVNRHLKLNQQVLQYTYCPQATWKWTQMWYSNNKNNSQIYRKREESAQAALPVPYPPTQKVSRSALQRAPSEKQKEHCLQRPGSQVWFVCVISVSGDVLAQNTEYTSVWKMLTKPKLFEDLYCHLNCQSDST